MQKFNLLLLLKLVFRSPLILWDDLFLYMKPNKKHPEHHQKVFPRKVPSVNVKIPLQNAQQVFNWVMVRWTSQPLHETIVFVCRRKWWFISSKQVNMPHVLSDSEKGGLAWFISLYREHHSNFCATWTHHWLPDLHFSTLSDEVFLFVLICYDLQITDLQLSTCGFLFNFAISRTLQRQDIMDKTLSLYWCLMARWLNNQIIAWIEKTEHFCDLCRKDD